MAGLLLGQNPTLLGIGGFLIVAAFWFVFLIERQDKQHETGKEVESLDAAPLAETTPEEMKAKMDQYAESQKPPIFEGPV
ncbi:MAG: hypothetical protein IT462_01615 [Planctomycetes bacterium]|nr:hypothetical protein [Planctomycetota bacterium]